MPGGGRALIPKEWTDLEPCPPNPGTHGKPHDLLGSVQDLLRARAVVDSLLTRRTSPNSDEKYKEEENANRATDAELSRSSHSGGSFVGSLQGRTKKAGRRNTSSTDRTGNCQEPGRGDKRS